jgi:hypothetical protein
VAEYLITVTDPNLRKALTMYRQFISLRFKHMFPIPIKPLEMERERERPQSPICPLPRVQPSCQTRANQDETRERGREIERETER